ncbi:hypothetical protein J4G08_15485 [Candidatus Poribacteria bacterium]|nr:hypothetical protein [Candidatus Poribacteria bacterium]
MADYELDEIHRIRREISAKFNHDMGKLVAHYQALEKSIVNLVNTNLQIHHLKIRNPSKLPTEKQRINY